MAVVVETEDADALLQHIRDLIEDEQIKIWNFEDDGDLNYKAKQYEGIAWFRPEKTSGGLRFKIMTNPKRKGEFTTEVKAIFHGRFIEMLLAHCTGHMTALHPTF